MDLTRGKFAQALLVTTFECNAGQCEVKIDFFASFAYVIRALKSATVFQRRT